MLLASLIKFLPVSMLALRIVSARYSCSVYFTALHNQVSIHQINNDKSKTKEHILLYLSLSCVYTALWLCYYSVQTLLSSRLPSKNLDIKIYKTIILPVVLYGCETWSLILSRQRVFENRIIRRIFGPKRDENGEWKRLHNQ